MISIRKFLGHDEKFYDLLEASAKQADNSVHHLVDLLIQLERGEHSPENLTVFAESRREVLSFAFIRVIRGQTLFRGARA